MTHARHLLRRTALKIGASAAALPLAHIRTAGGAGKVTGALFSLFVPGFAESFQRLVEEWADKTKTDVRIDFVSYTAQELSEAGEAQAQATMRAKRPARCGYPWSRRYP